MNGRLFGIITTKHSTEYTLECLKSFQQTVSPRAGDVCVLIDNDGHFPRESLLSPFLLDVHAAPKTFSENGNFLLKKARELKADLYFLNNDLILSDGWVEALGESQDSITSPLSTREVSYTTTVTVDATKHIQGTFRTAMGMDMAAYRGNETGFKFVAEIHRKGITNAKYPLLVVPFFCVRLPLTVINEVGDFDTRYGIGGGEDYDYCLRAIQRGFSVEYALSSYILHFGGKSTWSGPETREAQLERERIFRSYFMEKWGEPLGRYILLEDDSGLTEDPVLKELAEKREFQQLIMKAKKTG